MTYFLGQRTINEYQVNRGTHDPFSNLPDDGNLQLLYLIELFPYDAKSPSKAVVGLPVIYPGVSAFGEFDSKYGGAETIVRLSQAGYITKPTDSQANKNYLGRITDAIQIDTSIFGSSTFSGSQSFGGIEILNPDGRMDYLYDYFWDNRNVIVKAGTKDFTFDQFTIIFKGKIASIEGDETRILLAIGDNRAGIDQVVVLSTYGGTGGADGMASIIGMTKPLMFGQVFNIQPVLINYANQIFQLHDGAVTSIAAVRDRGVQLTFNADVPDIFAAATPPAGYYNTCLAKGLIRLGSTASGQITVDAIGETNAGQLTGVDLVYRILTTRLGIYNLTLADIDVGSFARARVSSPYAQGIFINEQIYGVDILDALVSAVDDYWSFTRQGQLFFGSPDIATSANSKVKRIKFEGVSLKQTIAAAYEVDVDYAKNYTVQSTNDLAVPTDADRVFAMSQYRSLSKYDPTVRAKNKASFVRSFETNIALKTDATTLLNKLATRHASKRSIYEMTVYNPALKYFVGDTVQLTHNRYNLAAGQNFLVIGISENAASNETKLTVWG